MKRYFAIIFLFASLTLSAQDYVMKERAQIVKELPKAAKWYKSGDPQKIKDADYIISCVAEHQVKDSESIYYGSMSWWYKSTKLGLNMAGFIAHAIFVDLWPLQDKMSEQAKKDFLQIARLIVVSEDRRFDEELFPVGRDEIEYSNAYCLSMQTVWLGAHCLNDKYYIGQAKNMWHRFYNFFRFYGNGEFASAHYEDVDFTSILDMWHTCIYPELKAQMQEVLDAIYISQTAYTHPLLKLPIVGASRDYRELQKGGDASSKLFKANLYDYKVPQKAVQLRDRRKYPLELSGRGGCQTPFMYKSYQTEHAGMGSMSGWGCYFYQNIHLVASVGDGPDARATMFVPGSYNVVNGFTDQKKFTSLVVYNKFPTLWHLTQWGGKIENYRKTIKSFGVGLSDGFMELENDYGHIVLTAYDYDFHIFPFSIVEDAVNPILMKRVHRKQTGEGVSQSRKADFEEYLFPDSSDWVGAVIKVVKHGVKVKAPSVSYKKNGDVTSFICKGEDLKVVVGRTEQGASVMIPDENVDLMPVFKVNQ